jgi:hypothetical protein
LLDALCDEVVAHPVQLGLPPRPAPVSVQRVAAQAQAAASAGAGGSRRQQAAAGGSRRQHQQQQQQAAGGGCGGTLSKPGRASMSETMQSSRPEPTLAAAGRPIRLRYGWTEQSLKLAGWTD